MVPAVSCLRLLRLPADGANWHWFAMHDKPAAHQSGSSWPSVDGEDGQKAYLPPQMPDEQWT